MKNPHIYLALLATSALAGVPHKMVAGQPARADSVNANFDYLAARIDSLVRTKVDSAFVARVATGYVDTPTFSAALGQKADSTGVFRSNQKRYSLFSFPDETIHQIKADSSGILIGRFAVRNGLEIGGSSVINGQWSWVAGQEGWRRLTLNAERTSILGALDVSQNIRTSSDLTVGGRIYASTDTITIPDYVFNVNYPLMRLPDLEEYIKQYGHLPEVPSEKQIRGQGGIDLAEMNLVLLKKIEELTLHVIRLDKQIQAQPTRSCPQSLLSD